jgi:hypothetical protein
MMLCSCNDDWCFWFFFEWQTGTDELVILSATLFPNHIPDAGQGARSVLSPQVATLPATNVSRLYRLKMEGRFTLS